MARARRAWRRRQLGFDPSRLIFLDESGAKTNLTRLCGRAPRGERVHASSPKAIGIPPTPSTCSTGMENLCWTWLLSIRKLFANLGG